MMTAKFALFCEASFWRVLHLAVAERPVFPGVVDEIAPDVFFSYAGPLLHLYSYTGIRHLRQAAHHRVSDRSLRQLEIRLSAHCEALDSRSEGWPRVNAGRQ